MKVVSLQGSKCPEKQNFRAQIDVLDFSSASTIRPRNNWDLGSPVKEKGKNNESAFLVNKKINETHHK